MNKATQKVTAILFLLMIFAMMVILLFQGETILEGLKGTYQTKVASESSKIDTINAVIDSAESMIDQKNPLRNYFIDLNGGFQGLMGKRYLEDANPMLHVYQLDNGSLTFKVEQTPIDWKAENMAALSEWCAGQETPLLYVQAPFKIDPQDAKLPVGVEDYNNRNADALLGKLNALGVDTLDLRAEIQAQGIDHDSLYYKTDSHWTTRAALWATETVAARLEKSYDFSIDEAVLNPENYQSSLYKDYFLGGQGKRVGRLYAGVDDLEVLIPKFETKLNYTVPKHNLNKSGDFSNTVLDFSHLESVDHFNKSPYYVYSGGDYPLATIRNEKNPQGKKILLVRDSFSCAVAPFLSLAVGQVDTFDLRYNTTPLSEYIMTSKPDMVVILYNPGVIRDDVMFRYGLEGQK